MSHPHSEDALNVKLTKVLPKQHIEFVTARCSRFVYLTTWISLRILVGREWRTKLLQKYWPRGDEPPIFVPTFVRKKAQIHELLQYTYLSERKVSELISDFHGNLFVDVGANIGYYTRLCARNFKTIMAIEADPDIASTLKSLLPPNAELINVAISDHQGVARFHRHNRTHWGTWLVGSLFRKFGTSSIRKLDTIDVATTTLTQVLGARYADLVKVDVEGAEWLVLAGAVPVMSRIFQWIIELHDLDKKEELEKFMTNYDYSCTWVDSSHAYFKAKTGHYPSLSACSVA